MSFSPDGRVLYAKLQRGGDRCWDAETGREVRSSGTDHSRTHRGVALANKLSLTAVRRGRRIFVLDSEGREVEQHDVNSILGDDENVFVAATAWTQERLLVVVGGDYFTYQVLDVNSGRELWRFDRDEPSMDEDQIRAAPVVFSPDSRFLLETISK